MTGKTRISIIIMLIAQAIILNVSHSASSTPFINLPESSDTSNVNNDLPTKAQCDKAGNDLEAKYACYEIIGILTNEHKDELEHQKELQRIREQLSESNSSKNNTGKLDNSGTDNSHANSQSKSGSNTKVKTKDPNDEPVFRELKNTNSSGQGAFVDITGKPDNDYDNENGNHESENALSAWDDIDSSTLTSNLTSNLESHNSKERKNIEGIKEYGQRVEAEASEQESGSGLSGGALGALIATGLGVAGIIKDDPDLINAAGQLGAAMSRAEGNEEAATMFDSMSQGATSYNNSVSGTMSTQCQGLLSRGNSMMQRSDFASNCKTNTEAYNLMIEAHNAGCGDYQAQLASMKPYITASCN